MKAFIIILLIGIVASSCAAVIKPSREDNGKAVASENDDSKIKLKRMADSMTRTFHAQLASLSTAQRKRALAAIENIATKLSDEGSDEYFVWSIIMAGVTAMITKGAGIALGAALG
uniref:Putative secreted protein n=1 Tax=Rhipicephalus microplus TaxID=6941 RepID=A0A6M2CGK3_RHIMP